VALPKAKDLRQLSEEELTERMEALRKEFFELTQKKEVGQVDRPHRFGHIRREIAQIGTVLSEKKQPRPKRKAV